MTQATLAAFIGEGHLARHVHRMRAIYADRHDVLLHALRSHCGQELHALPSLAGLHLCAALRGSSSADQWVQAAADAGIRIETLARHAQAPVAPNGLIFGYGLVDALHIEPAIRALAGVARRAGMGRGR